MCCLQTSLSCVGPGKDDRGGRAGARALEVFIEIGKERRSRKRRV